MGGVAGTRMAREAGGRDALDLGDRVVDVGERDRRGRRDPVQVRREPLGDVVVVHTRVGHRQLVVVGVEPEQRQVGVHHRGVDAVEGEVLDDDLGVTLRGAPAGLAVARDRPSLEARRVQTPEHTRAVLDEGLDLEVLFPDRAVAQVLGKAGAEQVGRLEDVAVGRDDEAVAVGHARPPERCVSGRVSVPPDRQPTGRYRRGGRRGEAVDPAPGRLHLGRLGRRRRARAHQPAHPREGPRGRAGGADRRAPSA